MFLPLALLLLLSIVDISVGLITIPCSSNFDCERVHSSARCYDRLCSASSLNVSCSIQYDCGYGQACIGRRCEFATVGDPCSLEYGCIKGSECAQNKCPAGADKTQCSPNVCKAEPNVHYCEASLRTSPKGFFCPYRFYFSSGIVPYFKCEVGSLGASDCFESKVCNGELLCNAGSGFWNSSCVQQPEYTRSNASDCFGVCIVDDDCPHRYYKKQSGSSRICQHCVQGRCHSIHVGQECQDVNDCSSFLSCINGRCDYSTEGVRCRRQLYATLFSRVSLLQCDGRQYGNLPVGYSRRKMR